jgi:hypothetical protein
MSTHGIIARPIGNGHFEGRYHHDLSWPSCLGRSIYDAYHNVFYRDLNSMLCFLLDEHTAGWSMLVGKDWHLPPGYTESKSSVVVPGSESSVEYRRACCYCHGDRQLTDDLWTDQDDGHCKYAYVINGDNATMDIYVKPLRSWVLLARIDFDRAEPNWELLEAPYHTFPFSQIVLMYSWHAEWRDKLREADYRLPREEVMLSLVIERILHAVQAKEDIQDLLNILHDKDQPLLSVEEYCFYRHLLLIAQEEIAVKGYPQLPLIHFIHHLWTLSDAKGISGAWLPSNLM